MGRRPAALEAAAPFTRFVERLDPKEIFAWLAECGGRYGVLVRRCVELFHWLRECDVAWRTEEMSFQDQSRPSESRRGMQIV